MKIKNKNYREFLDRGLINIIDQLTLIKALDNVTGRHRVEGRALLITLYFTGARPIEVLNLKGADFTKEPSYLKIQMRTAKRGVPRPIFLRLSNPLVKELSKYAMGLFPDMFIFYNYRSNFVKFVNTKKGEKEYKDISANLYYHVKKWFKDIIPDSISPYYLRHNRFSSLAAKGASRDDLKLLKGARSMNSVESYVHMTVKGAKKLARINE